MEEKLKTFMNDLKIIEEAMYMGIEKDSVLSVSNDEVFEVLNRVQKNIIMFRNEPLLRTSTIKDYNNFVSKNNVETLIGDLLFTLKRGYKSSENLSVSTMQLFTNIAKYMPRLKAIIENLLEEYLKTYKDDELFKPLNINKQNILSSLDKVLRELEKSTNLDQDYKKNILIIINEIKVDLAKENPPWSSIVGKIDIAYKIVTGLVAAGVVASTILIGLEKAYEHIMKDGFTSPVKTEIIYQVEPAQIKFMQKPTPQIENKEVIDVDVSGDVTV